VCWRIFRHRSGRSVTFAFITGWRIRSEVLPLEWRQVDFAAGEIRLDPENTKTVTAESSR
jgi:hypothetical protein